MINKTNDLKKDYYRLSKGVHVIKIMGHPVHTVLKNMGYPVHTILKNGKMYNGDRRDVDRYDIPVKVRGVLNFLPDEKYLSISNALFHKLQKHNPSLGDIFEITINPSDSPIGYYNVKPLSQLKP